MGVLARERELEAVDEADMSAAVEALRHERGVIERGTLLQPSPSPYVTAGMAQDVYDSWLCFRCS